MNAELRQEPLEERSSSQITLDHMLGKLSEDQIEHAKDIQHDRIVRGEAELRNHYRTFRKEFLKTSKPKEKAFTNYLDYLNFLWNNKPANIDSDIKKLGSREAGFMRDYRSISSKRKKPSRNEGFRDWLKKKELYIEVAYSDGRKKGKQASLIITRRKDTSSVIKKIARRQLESEINEELMALGLPARFEQKKIAIDDIFADKIVGYTPEDARDLFNAIYHHSHQFDLVPSNSQAPRIGKDGDEMGGYQASGVDDHYLYGTGLDNLIQMKFLKRYGHFPEEFESVTTDYLNMLIDEMDHIKYAQRKEKSLGILLSENTEFSERYNELVSRGEELVIRIPEKRRKIYRPDEFFKKAA